MRHDLLDVTFMIPVKLESAERQRNLSIITDFLHQNFDTHIIIYELGVKSPGPDTPNDLEEIPLVPDMVAHIPRVETIFESGFENGAAKNFHRTKYLNIMLEKVKTPIVANYDADILLDPKNIIKACNKIREKKADLVYPYHIGHSQGKIHNAESLLTDIETSGWSDTVFHKSLDRGEQRWEGRVVAEGFFYDLSMYGHVQIFNTESYRAGGGENERFKGWGPEDKERYYRFVGLGYTVTHMDNKIFHLEHPRGTDSSRSNQAFDESMGEAFKVINLNKTEMAHYAEELKKYNANNKS
jgi:predicted glycosyltransferase involved in capsule biosynthesis